MVLSWPEYRNKRVSREMWETAVAGLDMLSEVLVELMLDTRLLSLLMDADDLLISTLLIVCVPRAISRSSVPLFVLNGVGPVPWTLVMPLGDVTRLRLFVAVLAEFESMA
eukprot:14411394-Ditylum_brightwellii.AAC.1